MYGATLGAERYVFSDLKTLLAKATPLRSGDQLAALAAQSGEERVAAQFALADLPLTAFLNDAVVPYESCEVTRLILDHHDRAAFQSVAHLTVGGLRDHLLADETTTATLSALAPGITPEMAAAVAKISRAQDLIVMAAKCSVVTRFRNTLGLPGRLSVRLQPNHPTDDPRGIAASILDGLLLGAGDAVIGINPATDSVERAHALLSMLEDIRVKLDIPTQNCVLAHVTTTLALIQKGSPVDLVFQSIAGTETANKSFGIDLAMLAEAREAALSLRRFSLGDNVMYFETGQGSALSANAHHGVDQQTLEARAYAVARHFKPLLVNSVVGFIGPEYLFDGKQITRAGLEDHFCGKLLGLPMGVDVCYTNHADAAGPAGFSGSRSAARIAPKLQQTAADMTELRNDLWTDLRRLTAARIGLQRSGASLATAPLLQFQLAHARARDAVHQALDVKRLLNDLSTLGLPVLGVESAAPDRQSYLMRPDLGRRLAPEADATLAPHAGHYDVVCVVSDGLSARAVQLHATPVLAKLLPLLEGLRIAPLVIVVHGRVAAGDAVALALNAASVMMLIGERPGLTSPDSMGAYLTWNPGPSTTDADRNCISNIRPDGIGYADAAFKIAHLLRAMRARELSGVRLKDDSDRLLPGAPGGTAR